MRASVAVAVLSAVAASAQSAQNYTSALDMKIDPNKVKIEQRAVWCRAQTDTCGLLCGPADKNVCTPDTLKFDCTCASNKSMPGLQYYTQTVPTFICQELFQECISTNANKADEQAACKKNIQELCGKSKPPKASTSSSDNGDDSSETSSRASSPSSQRTGGSAATSTPGSLAPVMAPAGKGATLAAAALGLAAYLL